MMGRKPAHLSLEGTLKPSPRQLNNFGSKGRSVWALELKHFLVTVFALVSIIAMRWCAALMRAVVRVRASEFVVFRAIKSCRLCHRKIGTNLAIGRAVTRSFANGPA